MENLAFYQIFECITVVFETFIVHQYLSGLFEKRNIEKSALIWYVLFCIGLVLLSLFFPTEIILTIYTLVALYALSIIIYKANTLTRIIAVCYFAIIMMVAEAFTTGLFSGIGSIDLPDLLEYGSLRMFCIFVAKLIQIFLVRISISVVNLKTSSSSKIDFKMMFPILICQIFSIGIAYYIAMIWLRGNNELELITLLAMIGIIYVSTIIFWYFDRVKTVFEYKGKSEAAEYKLEMQKQYHETLLEHQQETDALWHDMKKHISLLKTLVIEGKHDISSSYINKLEMDVNNNISGVVRTDYPILSALLTKQKQQACKENIPYHIDIKLEDEIKIEPVDLCIVLGNLFDNAFEACVLLPPGDNRYVAVSIYQRNNAMAITYENTYMANVKMRQSARRHGIGLKNVRKAVSKYNGQVFITNDNNIFKVSILIP